MAAAPTSVLEAVTFAAFCFLVAAILMQVARTNKSSPLEGSSGEGGNRKQEVCCPKCTGKRAAKERKLSEIDSPRVATSKDGEQREVVWQRSQLKDQTMTRGVAGSKGMMRMKGKKSKRAQVTSTCRGGRACPHPARPV